ncbi:MAG: hypothetical protein AAFP19_05370 [Bacteroidota bacterium]
MKTKLVLWGSNEQDDKVLIAMELHPKENKVDVYTFPESIATEEFGKAMLDDWRNGTEVPFPEGYTQTERVLSVTESLLPDELKVERGDIIQRAQTEWHFIVLSSKLNEAYQSELNELKEKIDQLTSYDSEMWESLKGFWSKVQDQVRDRNLFREHANSLRDNTNALFSRLKDMRAALDEEFQNLSKEQYGKFMDSLEDVENRIKDGLKLQNVFEELKQMQRRFRETKLTREHRTKVWDRLDAAFKQVKEKRFGPNAGDSSPFERLKRRYDGLINAIEKMERSIQRDRDDLKFQNRKIANTDGQLEAQIRQAKIKMIEERIRSKEEKLGEMMQTKRELEERMEAQKAKDAKRAERERVEAARIAAKAKIAEEIKQAEAARQEMDEDLTKAADALNSTDEEGEEAAKESGESAEEMIEAISNTMGEALEDVVDTVKAVAEVVGGKITEAVSEFKEKAEAAAEAIKEEVVASEESSTSADDLKAVEGIGPKIEEILNQHGLKSFRQLAETSSAKIKEMLTTAGGSFGSHDPTTWPQQARMAAEGKWEELKSWQDELDGGKVVAKDSSEEE